MDTAAVTSTNLPGGTAAAAFWALATQHPSSIAAKPDALNRDRMRFLILT